MLQNDYLLAKIGVDAAENELSKFGCKNFFRDTPKKVEDEQGALERLLVDAGLGSFALPAPWDWRFSEPRWRGAAFLAESLAAANLALFWHGGVQAAVAA